MSQSISVNAHDVNKFMVRCNGLPSLVAHGVKPSSDETVVHITHADDCYLTTGELKQFIAWLQTNIKE